MKQAAAGWGMSFAFCGFAALYGAEPIQLSGQLAGRVSAPTGLPQMGASVSLFNRYDALVGRTLTAESGGFEFPMLPAGVYSVQVSLPSLISAVRGQIKVEPGMRSFVSINLATILSSIEFVYLAPAQRALMSEDWKWVLRGSGATRPGLRFLPGPAQAGRVRSAMFADTAGVIRVSAGEGASTTAFGNQTDLGTAFAVATSLFGGHRIEVSGNLGYASNAGVPTAGFHTSYSPAGADGAELGLTMRQVFLAGRAGIGMLTGAQAPVLRTYEATLSDRRRVGENLLLEYGSTLESVVFLDRLNFFSPYARISWGKESEGLIKAGYSSGAPPAALMGAPHAQEGEEPQLSNNHLQAGISALATLPRVSLTNGTARIQRTENMEIGYERSAGGRHFGASIYQETLRNAAAMMAGAGGVVSAGDLLPDLASRSSIFNYGRYRRRGATLMLTQSFGTVLDATVGYSYAGAIAPGEGVTGSDASELRDRLGKHVHRRGVLARISGTLPGSGTGYAASYQWTDYSAFQPVHYSLVQRSQFDPGLNVSLQQPIPGVSGMLPGRVVASAEMRNLMAQGYVPLDVNGGSRLLLIHSPRTIRGGLSFIF